MKQFAVAVAVVFATSAASAGAVLTPYHVVPQERPSSRAEQVVRGPVDVGARRSVLEVGMVDTVGGTTHDWQTNGPIYRLLVNSPEYGVHVAWMYSASTSTSHPDRNMRYNFYDFSTREWNRIDTNFMLSGISVFAERSGYGGLDADPGSGVAVVSGHLGYPLRIDVARDTAPGAGIFEYCSGSPELEGYSYPALAVDSAGRMHVHCMEYPFAEDNFCTRCSTWCNWTEPVAIYPPVPNAEYPDQNIAGSKVSDKVCVTWVYSRAGYHQHPGFYRISTDGGKTWGTPAQLDWPPAFSGDTLPSFHISSLFPFFDRNDELHIVAAVAPFLRDSNFIIPAEIWHWKPDTWDRIHRAECAPGNLQGLVGFNALYACRPSIGEGEGGELYAAWEQFDSSNYDPGTGLLRADIFTARSTDSGATWQTVQLTAGGNVSHRFPSVIDLSPTDTVTMGFPWVMYMVDQVAGFAQRGQGPVTRNPIVVQRPGHVGIEESGHEHASKPVPAVRSLVRHVLSLPGRMRAELLDISGRRVMDLEPGQNDVRHLAPGVYFLRSAESGRRMAVRKIVIQR
ncbi:MAG: hypothetical protein JSU73_04835 [candidate division WOR-3 bacterium]|nr:MAG: hypothetical protein JSU73_04835 [candidate division WOR-3 bacterium]